ncbi:hypothetical protein QA639_21560 [Bradyrhizobium pachyrhizi]|uniref:hypothetical protein n=1 Tax=Bradyrhizobium pachyrhizi TaxID=280333 RepID=UPI0024B0ADB8|nr:hypothetical protein [Bradyrhizobium pachyrhizi]WFU52297.1 hypothetical protein QA639_21560 [Bradyrhizobium pachyrhizi]
MGYRFDLENRVAVHDRGFIVAITDLYDRFGEYTDDPEEAVVIGMVMPPDGMYVTLDLRDLDEDDIVTSLQ